MGCRFCHQPVGAAHALWCIYKRSVAPIVTGREKRCG